MSNTILVVEDEKYLSEALRQKLTKEGYEVLTAANGLEGLQQAYASKPDLILLDIIMPKMDGIRMLEELRKDKWGQYVPVMILSNINQPENIDPDVRSKISAYIVKSNSSITRIVELIKAELNNEI